MATPNLTPNSAQEPQSNAARPQTSLELTAAFFETLEGYDQTVQDLRSINARIAARDENTAHDTEPSKQLMILFVMRTFGLTVQP